MAIQKISKSLPAVLQNACQSKSFCDLRINAGLIEAMKTQMPELPPR
jgi:hypothetical protein